MTRSRRASAQRPLPPAAFVDRVMAAVRLEAPPTPARALGGALRRGSLSDAGSALAVAWHLATVRTWVVAPSVRARSLALVLAVALALISGSLAAAGAVRLASEPVTRLLQVHVDDQGPLAIPPATVNEPGSVDPDANDEDEGEPASAADDEHDGDDAADVEESTDADDADDEAAEPEVDVDEAETDEAEQGESDIDQPEVDEPDTDDDADSNDAGDASDDAGSVSETDN